MSKEVIFECVVSAELFRRAALAVSASETRYYLNGVHISPAPEGGAVLVATDGSFLIAMHDPEAYVHGEGIVLLTKPMKTALKASGVMLDRRLLAVRDARDGQRAFVVDVATKGASESYSPYLAAREVLDAPDKRVQSAQFGAVTIDGAFPNWRNVLPKKLLPDAPTPPLNQALLSRAAEALSTDRSRSVRLTSSGPNDPVLVTSMERAALAGFAIVMPVRHEATKAALPAWAALTQAKAA